MFLSLQFCQAGGFSPIPVSQSLLCMYVSYLAEQKLKHRIISAVRNLQIASGLPDPFTGAAMPQLVQVLKGIKEAWSDSMLNHDTKMTCCLCFFAFLRAGEMTVPSDSGYDPSVHLSINDISVDNSSRPLIICQNKAV